MVIASLIGCLAYNVTRPSGRYVAGVMRSDIEMAGGDRAQGGLNDIQTIVITAL